jgi:hypothetical protein
MKRETSSNLRRAGLLVAVAALSALVLILNSRQSDDTAPLPETPQTPARSARTGGDRAAPLETFTAEPAAEPARGSDRTHNIDLSMLREMIPDNSYWRLGEPTQDPAVLELRAKEQAGWDLLKGKVVSNTATEEEIDRYYEHRRKLSEDYIRFSELVLEHFGDRLPESEVGAHELSIKLHSGRLLEIPRQRQDALARKVVQDKRREEWKQSRAKEER